MMTRTLISIAANGSLHAQSHLESDELSSWMRLPLVALRSRSTKISIYCVVCNARCIQ